MGAGDGETAGDGIGAHLSTGSSNAVNPGVGSSCAGELIGAGDAVAGRSLSGGLPGGGAIEAVSLACS